MSHDHMATAFHFLISKRGAAPVDFAAGAAACSGRNARELRKCVHKKSERGCADNQEHSRRVTLTSSKKVAKPSTRAKLWTVDGDVGSSFECLTISREAR